MILPDFEEIRRCCGVIENNAAELQRIFFYLDQEVSRLQLDQENFSGLDWRIFQLAIRMLRLSQHMEKLLAIDTKTLKSPYMKSEVVKHGAQTDNSRP